MANVQIQLKRSLIGRPQNQIDTAKALGLTKTYKTVVKPDNEAVRGMINTIKHLVEVKEA
ncbi:50S ribosomal protein L30 [Vaginisenegalia massiliensis]|uniref:50S ribosomal protein L30 n=1 Tax=Vaginisenegalia massiliensis TaxID=2058294 RepID=UPI000F53C0DD|nr:50S ribosomal protein L30 [Vaginisenegalia massiliensis]